ncbi:MAG: hypothetical protein O3B24_00660 [Verrucomicrobia bacterium]|nr:hypothetical protein [Verrucomicrobiota bacterium]
MKAPVSIKGGESVYCINEGQLRDAIRLANEDPQSSPRIQKALGDLETSLTRNERAALAFTMIERLRTSKA